MPDDTETGALPGSMRLFVGGLHEAVTKSDLQERFGRFGRVASVDVRTKRDTQGQISNVFAYMDIDISQANFKKCLSTYNDTKWKGRTMKVQVAKENFLDKLAKERQEAEESSCQPAKPTVAKTKQAQEQEAARARLEENLKKAGVEDFTMKKAVPGTPIPGEADWIVAKFGRVLPIMHMLRRDRRSKMTYDPSKYVHHVRKFKEDAAKDRLMSAGPVEDLTWHLAETTSEMDRKRMGEFPDSAQRKKVKSTHPEVIFREAQSETARLHHSGAGKFPKPSDLDFEIVPAKGNRSAVGQRTALVKLKPYSALTQAASLTRKEPVRQSDGVEDLLRQCRLEEEEDSCGSADTDDICSSAKKSEAVDREAGRNWAEEYYNKERIAAMAGDTEELPGFGRDVSAAGTRDHSSRASSASEASAGATVHLDGKSRPRASSASEASAGATVHLDGKSTSGAWSGSGKVKEQNGQGREELQDIPLDSDGDDSAEEVSDDEVERVKFDGDEEDDAHEPSATEDKFKTVPQNLDRCSTAKNPPSKGVDITEESQRKDLGRRPRNDDSDEEDDEEELSTSGSNDSSDNEDEGSSDDSDNQENAASTGLDDSFETAKSPRVPPDSDEDSDEDAQSVTEESAEDSDSSSDDEDPADATTPGQVLPIRTTDTNRCTPKVGRTAAVDSAGSQRKHELSDKIRLESVKRRQATIVTQKAAVQEALKSVDLKGSMSAGTHVRFDSESESSDAEGASKVKAAKPKDKPSSKRLPGLFDDDDDDFEEMVMGDGSDKDRFKIKPQFQGKAGEKLLQLQDRIGTDDRFKLGEMFMEDKEGDSDDGGEADENLNAEKEKQAALHVLESIVGSHAMQSVRSKTISNFRDPRQMRYDPTREDHAHFELADSSTGSVLKRNDKTADEPPEVSKEVYHQVGSLAFGQDKEGSEPFRFFAEEEPKMEGAEGGDGGFNSLQKDILATTTLGRRQWKLDSSDSDSESEDEEEEGSEAKPEGQDDGDEAAMETAPSNKPASATKAFFFKPDDARLKTGPALFCRKLSLEGMNQWFEEQKAELQAEYKKRHQRAMRDAKKAAQQSSKKPRR